MEMTLSALFPGCSALSHCPLHHILGHLLSVVSSITCLSAFKVTDGKDFRVSAGVAVSEQIWAD